ncbi:undecaprenyl-diphosphate phosphatase [Balneolaceae bacterium ANBcel3]|nr:undecaprenyl-diphosphate phosphatase [Balneolaceae bacterium ANBcel3]
MSILEALLLGILQGITEFLPVSSSGHLVLAQSLLASELAPGITFEIVVHFGSFSSIALYYRKKIMAILIDLIKSFSPEGIRSKRYTTDPHTRLSWIILLSVIPAGVVGFTMKEQIESLFMNPVLVSGMLLVTGALLFSTRFVGKTEKDVNVRRGFIIGIAQACAIIPGISRSGSTITTGLLCGVSREHVANFSFLMVLPVLAGAMLVEMLELRETGMENLALASLVVGYFASFISGFYALKYLIILLKRDKIYYFAYYCWPVGVAGLIYFSM